MEVRQVCLHCFCGVSRGCEQRDQILKWSCATLLSLRKSHHILQKCRPAPPLYNHLDCVQHRLACIVVKPPDKQVNNGAQHSPSYDLLEQSNADSQEVLSQCARKEDGLSTTDQLTTLRGTLRPVSKQSENTPPYTHTPTVSLSDARAFYLAAFSTVLTKHSRSQKVLITQAS